MTTLSMTNARHSFTDIANQVMFQGERVCIKKNNKRVLALIPIEDLEALEAIEDSIDLQDALKALKEKGGISLLDLKKKLRI